jgi:hypothetical protein
MAVVTSPIDEYHAISLELIAEIRSWVAISREYVAAWEPRPYRRESDDGTQ